MKGSHETRIGLGLAIKNEMIQIQQVVIESLRKVIFSRVIMICTLLFSIMIAQKGLAQDRSLDIKLSLYVNAPEGTLLENQMYGQKIRLLDLSQNLFFERLRVKLVQISDHQIRVEMERPLELGFYSREGTRNLKIESFIFKDSPKNIDLMMNLSPGTFHSDKYAKWNQIQKFMDSLSSMGITKKMMRFFNTEPPIRVLKVSSLSVSINVTDLIQEKAIKLGMIHYLSELIVGTRFYDIALKYVPIELSMIDHPFVEEDPVLKKYLETYAQYKARYAQLSFQGWLKGLQIPRQRNLKNQEDFDTRNVVSLFSKNSCSLLFKK